MIKYQGAKAPLANGMTTGARVLGDALKRQPLPHRLGVIGGFERRCIRFHPLNVDGTRKDTGQRCSDAISLHSSGRALDVMVSHLSTTERQKELGDAIVNAVLHPAVLEAYRVQEVIWWKRRWSVNDGQWHAYSGPSEHKDHVHVSVDTEGGEATVDPLPGTWPSFGDWTDDRAMNEGRGRGSELVATRTTSDREGSWGVTKAGGVMVFGTARFFGEMAGQPLNAPIVDMLPTRIDAGYWLLGADGGLFGFGDAMVLDSAAGKPYFEGRVAQRLEPGVGGSVVIVATSGERYGIAGEFAPVSRTRGRRG